MCGIIAIYDPQTRATLDAKSLAGRIDDSLGYIAHRGPDATGVWVSDDASCGECGFRPSLIGRVAEMF